MTTQLIPVFTGEINQTQQSLCDARELYRFLGVKQHFGNWMNHRIRQYEFTKGVDFMVNNKTIINPISGGRPSIEYHLTLDTAKELAMVERNDKGREARRYFIECERRLISGISTQQAETPTLDAENAQLKVQLAQQAEMLELYRFKANTLQQQSATPPKPKRKASRPLTQNEINAIHGLHQQGYSNSAIAKQIGRSMAAVSYVVRGAQVGAA